jgi:hypothetical protein
VLDVLDDVFTQDGHFLLPGEMSAALFHWISFRCPTQ